MFPVEEKIPDILASLAANHAVVLTAPPGSGKTTRVPLALLDAPFLANKKILMLEPRRLAARSAATYLASQRGERVGETVGYSVRLERCVSKATRLEIVTEALLAQRILRDPFLEDVGLLIFDEFHERSLACDLSFALALDVRRSVRDDLRLLVMSATLDTAEVASHMAANGLVADVVESSGRMFPVETVYLPEASIPAAMDRALRETRGDVLVFLPGEGEIKRIIESSNNRIIEGRPPVDFLPLYGNLPKEEQDRVFAPSARRKVILATSIAETSLTIEGVTAVVDSGLMRVPRFSPGSGMTRLVTCPLTLDRAEQRRGRAGRVEAGRCYRLWSEAAEASRPKKMWPEIAEADLSSLVLTSVSWGALRREDLPWLTPPEKGAWEQALRLLKDLGAVDEDTRLTEKGRNMASLPMHPRLANMCLECGRDAAPLAALLEEGGAVRETDIRARPRTRRVELLAKRFASRLPATSSDYSIGAMLSFAYPDRIGKNRGHGSFQMTSGRGAFLERNDPLAREPYLVCCELDDRAGDAKIFAACPIEEGEIEALWGARIREEPFCAWNAAEERVVSVTRRQLGSMVMREKPFAGEGIGERQVEALLTGIRTKGVALLPGWTKESRQLRDRLAFLSRVFPTDSATTARWEEPTDEAVLASLRPFVSGILKWRDLAKVDMNAVLGAFVAAGGHTKAELERLAPARLRVPSGSNILLTYEGADPTCEVKLQECFGMLASPKIADGRVAVVMTLLSPAMRPIQVTKDLEGFWRGAYQLVRKDMRGRYPKHNWPEDPLLAIASRRTLRERRA